MLFSLLDDFGAEVVPLTARHAATATAAFLRFGRGHHPASLNFGDRMSYAIAAEAGMPLLYAGNDFAQTDIASAIG